LAEAVPYRALGQWPTPVQRAWRFGTTIGCDQFWIKRDDQAHPVCGGNKVRGLEFLLGQAQGHQTLFVVSTNGSNHLVATAYHAAPFGQRVVAVTFPQPWTELVERNQRVLERLGVERHPVPSLAALPRALWRTWRQVAQRDGDPPYWMPLGGTSPLSCLGHVNAALELAEQVRVGQMPEPDAIFVPVGSGGTLAGLLLGVRLAGLNTEVLGVRVTARLVANATHVAWLYNRTRALITRHHPTPLPAPRLRPRDVTIRHDCCGRGYGLWTPSGLTLLRRMAREERIELDGTYTAKALDGLVRTVQERRWQKRVILFWNTYGMVRREA
jgi:D-cysteine desulfhydrase